MKERLQKTGQFAHSVEEAARKLARAGFSGEIDCDCESTTYREFAKTVETRGIKGWKLCRKIIGRFEIIGLVDLIVREDPLIAKVDEKSLRLLSFKEAGDTAAIGEYILFADELRDEDDEDKMTTEGREDTERRVAALREFQSELKKRVALPISEAGEIVEDSARPFVGEAL